MTTTLYRMRDAGGQLLYVGISHTTMSRFHQHKNSKWWWVQVASVDVEHFETRGQALWAEREAIQKELPRYNTELHPQPLASVLTAMEPAGDEESPVVLCDCHDAFAARTGVNEESARACPNDADFDLTGMVLD